jgi:hypothetical protein
MPFIILFYRSSYLTINNKNNTLLLILFTTKAKGMGFGLSICKRIIEAHGGTISVESTIGKGSSLKVTLPLKGKITNNQQSRYLSTPELTKIIDTMIKESKGKNEKTNP